VRALQDRGVHVDVVHRGCSPVLAGPLRLGGAPRPGACDECMLKREHQRAPVFLEGERTTLLGSHMTFITNQGTDS